MSRAAVSTPEGWLDPIYVNDPPEDAKLTLGKTVNSDGCTWSQIRWVSSNDAVATIDPVTGVIHPLANGTVEFWLEAVNGGLEEYQGSEYQSEHIKLIIQEGRVAVNGEVCTMRGKKLRPGDRAVIDDETELVVQ